jgi:Predicted metal-dependent hydrolase
MGLLGEATRTITHPLLGTVCFTPKRGNRNFRLRVNAKGVFVSYPSLLSLAQAQAFLEAKLPWVQEAIVRVRAKEAQAPAISLQELEQLWRQAHVLLPPRLATLAQQHGFQHEQVRIKNNRSNWGSCSGKNNINLNFRLVTLPAHLQDYVLLHELCHTRIKNHGPQFWALLDSHTNGRAKALAKELRTIKLSF